jgi:hypothetical protein
MSQPGLPNSALSAVRELARLSALELPKHVAYAPWTRVSFENGVSIEANGDVTNFDDAIFRNAMEKLHPLLKASVDTTKIISPSPTSPSDSVAFLLLKILFSKRAIVDCHSEAVSTSDLQWWRTASQLFISPAPHSTKHARPRNVTFLDFTNRKALIESSVPDDFQGHLQYIEVTSAGDLPSGFIDSISDSIVITLFPLALDERALYCNRRLLELNIPFLRCGIGETAFECGPLVIPDSSTCLECMWRRQLGTQPILERFVSVEQKPTDSATPIDLVLFGFLWLEILRIVTTGQTPQTIGHIISGEPFLSTVSRRRILRLPNCPSCG